MIFIINHALIMQLKSCLCPSGRPILEKDLRRIGSDIKRDLAYQNVAKKLQLLLGGLTTSLKLVSKRIMIFLFFNHTHFRSPMLNNKSKSYLSKQLGQKSLKD